MTPEEQEYLEQQRIELKAMLAGMVKTAAIRLGAMAKMPRAPVSSAVDDLMLPAALVVTGGAAGASQKKTAGWESRLLNQFPGPGGPAAFAAAVANHSPHRPPSIRAAAPRDALRRAAVVGSTGAGNWKLPAALAGAVGAMAVVGRSLAKRRQAAASKRLLKRLAIGGAAAAGVTGLTVPLALAAGRRDKQED